MFDRIRKAAVAVVIVAAIPYLAANAYLFAFQRDYVFKPSGELALPAGKGMSGVEVLTLTAADGTKLTGWYQPARPDRPTVLYFHGNAGNVSERASRFKRVVASGFGFLAVSYRGYAGSGGSPSEAGFFSDGLEIYDWLAARTENIVIYGESLGTATATYVASERPGRALILEAPFTAALDIAAATYPWVPVGLLMHDPFLSRDYMQRVDEPVLIVQGTVDEVVPLEQGKKLFDIAHEPKRFAVIDGGSHSDLWDRGLWPAALNFLREQGVIAGS